MENLENVIINYLKKSTDYALLIKGNWGIGKTFYYKNVISNLINKTETINDATEKYKSIHISLFGLTSLEDIQSQIFLSLYPIIKNKTVKLSIGVGKAILRGVVNFTNLGNIDDYISDAKSEMGTWIGFEQIVICFDDLERKSENFSLEELIGYINTLVENNNAKVIIIANDDKIDHSKYIDLKEKVVGITIEFLPNLKKNVEEIIKNRYETAFKEYAVFLKDNIEYILEFSSNIQNNLRVLIYSLDNLQDIFYVIKKNIIDLPNDNKLIITEKLYNLLIFTLAVSDAYKKNEISYSTPNGIDIEDMNHMQEMMSNMSFSGDQENTKENYKNIFINRYYKSRIEYKYFMELGI